LLGPGDVERHVEHGRGFAAASPSPPPPLFADLGSGAGIPGLVLAVEWGETEAVLIESSTRRAAFLGSAIADLGLGGRVSVELGRAETVGRKPRWRHSLPLVVARSFGPPAVVAECAAPLLRLGGSLVVSEPPGGRPERWPAEALRELGLKVDARVAGKWAFQTLVQDALCPARYPRRPGIPTKRPLF
jgi:16S rRNA (guanine527-N7)-methyltransferase